MRPDKGIVKEILQLTDDLTRVETALVRLVAIPGIMESFVITVLKREREAIKDELIRYGIKDDG